MLRLLAILIFCFIVVSLGMALYSLVTNKSESTATVKALTRRIIAAVALFIMIVLLALFDIFPRS